jgi:hypothetical protein
MKPSQPQVTVFKGGTAFNSLLRDFQAAFPAASYRASGRAAKG